MHYCRTERRPYMLEALVSRLYGHSSSSGARAATTPIASRCSRSGCWHAGLIDQPEIDRIHEEAKAEADAAAAEAVQRAEAAAGGRREAFTYAPSPVDAVYPDDYTGLP